MPTPIHLEFSYGWHADLVYSLDEPCQTIASRGMGAGGYSAHYLCGPPGTLDPPVSPVDEPEPALPPIVDGCRCDS